MLVIFFYAYKLYFYYYDIIIIAIIGVIVLYFIYFKNNLKGEANIETLPQYIFVFGDEVLNKKLMQNFGCGG